MQKRELLVSTVQHYTTENRALVNGVCLYSCTTNSLGCAIGRFLEPEVALAFDNVPGGAGIGIIAKMEEYKQLLPNWMLELGIHFLSEIQKLHDCLYCWDTNGITEEGKHRVSNICTTFDLEPLTDEEFTHKD